MIPNKKPIQKYYAKSIRDAQRYSKGRESYADKYYKIIIKQAKIKSGNVIIDLPCGTGNLSSRIEKTVHSKKIYMIDINSLMLK